jgi:hypothetical protein
MYEQVNEMYCRMIRTFWHGLYGAAALYILTNIFQVRSLQAIASDVIQMTMEESGTRPNDVYSPKLIYQTLNGQRTLVMYFGGWYRTDSEDLPNDSIYRAVCLAPDFCGVAQKVIDPVAGHLGLASMVNNPTIVELHNYGQDYLVMYMTGVTGADRNNAATVQNNKIFYSISWAADGIRWSVPKLLIDEAWLPSATVDADGNVLLYANTNWTTNPHFLSRYNLGPSGLAVSKAEPVVTDAGVNYTNVEVKYRKELARFQIVAQQASLSFNSEVDYLESVDGVRWDVHAKNITPPGMTPGVHPDTSCWVYYGLAPKIYFSNIFLKVWC